jgi:hypothetical protein
MILPKARPFRQMKAFTRLSRKEDGLSRKTIGGGIGTGRTISGNTGYDAFREDPLLHEKAIPESE